MNKTAIKNYAVWARRKLIESVKQRAFEMEITDGGVNDPGLDTVAGRPLGSAEKTQRAQLIAEIKARGYESVMEEAAYTWFNRFIALRFMEVNGYLPSKVRVFTDENGEFKPEILKQALSMDLDGLDRNRVLALLDAQDNEGLYQYLLITQCNAFNEALPYMFETISNWTEILFPANLLRPDSVISRMISNISEEDWSDQVEIIGWLYQYYIAEPKDILINAHKQYKDKDIPFVTQLFTSDWIVHFMVDNSLGKLWLEGHPNDEIKSELKFYLEEDKQTPETQKKLKEIRSDYAKIQPEEIKVIDPCMGSGHILVVLFDLLVRIYVSCGYSERDAAQLIVEKNLFGLDIDKRAAQLAYFAVMMKARQYDRRFLFRNLQPHVYVIDDSRDITDNQISAMGQNLTPIEKASALEQIRQFLDEMQYAKEYGSIIDITPADWYLLRKFATVTKDDASQLQLDLYGNIRASEKIQFLINIGEILSQKYHVVVTNPPYLNTSMMPGKLKAYVQEKYPDFKNDMFAVFTRKVMEMTLENGHIGLLMPYVWMFISSYEKMRKYVNDYSTITSLVQLEYNAFEAACVPVAALTMCKTNIHYNGEYIKLSEFRGSENQEPKTLQAVNDRKCGYRYTANQNDFNVIPSAPIAYWIGKGFIDAFSNKRLGEISKARRGLETGNNEKYIHYWFEVLFSDIEFNCRDISLFKNKWLPHNKGGDYRTWYGNDDLIVWFKDNGKDIRESGTINGYDVFLQEGITWTALTSSKNSFRFSYAGHTFDSNKGPLIVDDGNHILYYLLAFFNSHVAQKILKILNPTMSLQNGDVDRVPIIFQDEKKENIDSLSKENIFLSKQDWDSFETSWGFQKHPLI